VAARAAASRGPSCRTAAPRSPEDSDTTGPQRLPGSAYRRPARLAVDHKSNSHHRGRRRTLKHDRAGCPKTRNQDRPRNAATIGASRSRDDVSPRPRRFDTFCGNTVHSPGNAGLRARQTVSWMPGPAFQFTRCQRSQRVHADGPWASCSDQSAKGLPPTPTGRARRYACQRPQPVRPLARRP